MPVEIVFRHNHSTCGIFISYSTLLLIATVKSPPDAGNKNSFSPDTSNMGSSLSLHPNINKDKMALTSTIHKLVVFIIATFR